MLKIKHFLIFLSFGCIISISAHAEILLYEVYAGDDPCGSPIYTYQYYDDAASQYLEPEIGQLLYDQQVRDKQIRDKVLELNPADFQVPPEFEIESDSSSSAASSLNYDVANVTVTGYTATWWDNLISWGQSVWQSITNALSSFWDWLMSCF